MARRVLAAAAALVTFTAVPAAAQYGQGATLGVSAGTAVRGAPIAVAGSGFAAGELVSLAFGSSCGPKPADGAVVGSVQADRAGEISTRLTVPATARPGRHGIRAGGRWVTSCTDLLVVASATEVGSGITRTAAPGQAAGRGVALLGRRGLAILLGGGLLLVLAHRRPSGA